MTWLVAIVGVTLRLAHYLRNWSLWYDEAALAIRLSHHSLAGWIGPVGYAQAAPPGFLFVSNLATAVFGQNEYSLRLWPLVCGIAALPLAWKVGRRTLGVAGGLVALTLAAFAPPLVYYSAEFKPYGCDATVTLALLLVALPLLHGDRSRARVLSLSIAGTVAILFSFPAVFMLAGIGLSLLGADLWSGRRKDAAWLCASFLPWVITFGVVYAVFMRPSRHDAFLVDYWRNAFMPFPPVHSSDLLWLRRAFFRFFHYVFGRTAKYPSAVLYLIGLVAVWRHSRLLLAMLVLPLLAALAASSQSAYPFEQRLLLYGLPTVLVVMACGLQALWPARAWPASTWPLALVTSLLFVPFWLTPHDPADTMGREDLRPALQYLGSHIRPGDRIYVYRMSTPAYTYYIEMSPVTGAESMRGANAFLAQGIHRGHGNYVDPRDFDTFRGSPRIWLVFSHPYNDDGDDEVKMMIDTLHSRGARKLDSRIAENASVYLFDCTMQSE